jgi:stearoyl-CoA desaturase (delta-9 desaturase)
MFCQSPPGRLASVCRRGARFAPKLHNYYEGSGAHCYGYKQRGGVIRPRYRAHVACATPEGNPLITNLIARIKNSNWITIFFLAAFHVGAVAALFFFSWQSFAMAVALWWIAGGLGIGMGYHRLLTHRGYKTPKWLEYTMAVCATLALEGGPIFWVGTHRIHHRFTDQAGDPHSPRDGKWWSHVGWILGGKSMHRSTEEFAPYVPDLLKDKFHVWLSKWHWVPLTTLGFVVLALFGWEAVLWTIFLRVTVGLHCTWLVNSATHLWGSQRFATGDDSRNSFWVALLTFGEGWHNNHHAHAQSARHGLRWWEFDLNWYGIQMLRMFGLARDIKLPRLNMSVREIDEQARAALAPAE